MYCKFCGSVLNESAVQCDACEGKISLQDGGQSFFIDAELKAWQTSPDVNVTEIIPYTPTEQQREASMATAQPQNETEHKQAAFITPRILALTAVVLLMAILIFIILICLAIK